MPQPGWDYTIFALLLFISFLDLAKAASYQLQSYDFDSDNDTMSNNISGEEELDGGEVVITERPFSWLRNANSMLSGTAGHVVIQVAKELIHRSAGNSQVLSLNLTNLLIIILLKVLIFTAGMLGAGHWTGYGNGYGRSAGGNYDFSLGLSPGDDYLITGFLAAQGTGKDECLQAASCACPNAAYAYARAGRHLLGLTELIQGEAPVEKPRYLDLIVLMEKSAHNGYRGDNCNTTYKCDGIL
ncbi:hypothetical protein KR038_003708 [Drosophila bunnanda]|nr:hypothetical protein KR038_003708 [Drosophila bunnanda]